MVRYGQDLVLAEAVPFLEGIMNFEAVESRREVPLDRDELAALHHAGTPFQCFLGRIHYFQAIGEICEISEAA